MRRQDGAVGYLKDDVLQTLVDARGGNLAPHVDEAVSVLQQTAARSVLVLGFGGELLRRCSIDPVQRLSPSIVIPAQRRWPNFSSGRRLAWKWSSATLRPL